MKTIFVARKPSYNIVEKQAINVRTFLHKKLYAKKMASILGML